VSTFPCPAATSARVSAANSLPRRSGSSACPRLRVAACGSQLGEPIGGFPVAILCESRSQGHGRTSAGGPVAAAAPTDSYAELTKLKELFDGGILTQDESDAEEKKVLSA